jgi:hypothetical protein
MAAGWEGSHLRGRHRRQLMTHRSWRNRSHRASDRARPWWHEPPFRAAWASALRSRWRDDGRVVRSGAPQAHGNGRPDSENVLQSSDGAGQPPASRARGVPSTSRAGPTGSAPAGRGRSYGRGHGVRGATAAQGRHGWRRTTALLVTVEGPIADLCSTTSRPAC